MVATRSKLYDLVDVTCSEDVLAEIKHIVGLTCDTFDYETLDEIFADVVRLFHGDYPGFQASNTAYHDLEHTQAVALALTRLAHGYAIDRLSVSPHLLLVGISSGLFHDTGLIQEEKDLDGSGAKYTIGHEERSIAFMRQYYQRHGFSDGDAEDCTALIHCTILNKPVREVRFRTAEIDAMGKILGTADLLAQMADRQYLEKLSLLFQEFEEGGLPGYESELDLLDKTVEFYQQVANKRLTEDLANVAVVVRSHFRVRWGIDRDLYAESISRNIDYVKSLHKSCKERANCYKDALRRGTS